MFGIAGSLIRLPVNVRRKGLKLYGAVPSISLLLSLKHVSCEGRPDQLLL